MSAPALVSVRRDGAMVMKIVAGCNGMNASQFKEEIQKLTTLTSWTVVATAVRREYGCEDCLVIVTPELILAEGLELTGDELTPYYLFRKTFNDPLFNPRWRCGTAQYVEVVDL